MIRLRKKYQISSTSEQNICEKDKKKIVIKMKTSHLSISNTGSMILGVMFSFLLPYPEMTLSVLEYIQQVCFLC